jgi:WD40 repeat protein
VVAACGSALCTWEATGPRRLHPTASGAADRTLSLSADISLTSARHRVLVVDTTDREITAILDGHAGADSGMSSAVRSMTLSPDGSVADPDTIRTLSTTHPDSIAGLAWHPDGSALATASSEATGEPAPTPSQPRDMVQVHRVDGPPKTRTLTLPPN